MPLLKSWIASANSPTTDFPLNNLPCGVFSLGSEEPRCGVAIGDMILDVSGMEYAGLIDLPGGPVFDVPFWNDFMELGPEVWAQFRTLLLGYLVDGAESRGLVEAHLVRQADATMHLPFLVAEFTDFYASRHHAENVGTMLRGAENALPPNWLHMPVGYNGRASSIIVSGTDLHRPWGQVRPSPFDAPVFQPSARFDFELELGTVVGQPSTGMVDVAQADEMIFGYVLLNDWSARDVQAWEYQPLGPFQSKAAATTISPWVVMKAALEPFRAEGPRRDRPLLPYLHEPRPMLYDIALEIALASESGRETVLTHTNMRELYYSPAQQLCHHTTSGCPINTGDLLGTGTISGPDCNSRGCMLELSWGGAEPVVLETGDQRTFLQDGDRVTLRGWADGPGYRIGFGECTGKVLPALEPPAGWRG